jgi:tRNA-Thr(GGU) m(6)t(6)A37 methyltransferase TsaA
LPEPYTLFPVGRVRSAVTDPSAAPHQGRESGTEAFVEIDDAYADALDGIEQFDTVIVLCWFHLSRRDLLQVHPRGDESNPLRGVFATRSPLRPNPIAVYTARLLERNGTTLKLRGIDAVDGTPVIDIRPHRARLDD